MSVFFQCGSDACVIPESNVTCKGWKGGSDIVKAYTEVNENPQLLMRVTKNSVANAGNTQADSGIEFIKAIINEHGLEYAKMHFVLPLLYSDESGNNNVVTCTNASCPAGEEYKECFSSPASLSATYMPHGGHSLSPDQWGESFQNTWSEKPDTIRRAVVELIGAVQRMHELGFAHMDLRLPNMLWDKKNSRIRLIDFDRVTSPEQPIHVKQLVHHVYTTIAATELTIRGENTSRNLNWAETAAIDTATFVQSIYQLFTALQATDIHTNIKREFMDVHSVTDPDEFFDHAKNAYMITKYDIDMGDAEESPLKKFVAIASKLTPDVERYVFNQYDTSAFDILKKCINKSPVVKSLKF
jgi:serine/threonine protein kinase